MLGSCFFSTSSLPQLKTSARGVIVSVVKTEIKHDSTNSFSDQLSMSSISTPSELKDVGIGK